MGMEEIIWTPQLMRAKEYENTTDKLLNAITAKRMEGLDADADVLKIEWLAQKELIRLKYPY